MSTSSLRAKSYRKLSTTREPSDEDLVLTPAIKTPKTRASKTRAFWMSFVALTVSTFLSAMDLTAIGTALPAIVTALDDDKGDYSWVGSAYSLSSTAVIPLSGRLADVLGRRPIILNSIGFFCVGSILAGASQNMPMMISARGIQGLGGGGILTLSEILISDLVPLAERGTYEGIIGLVWALATSIGPPLVRPFSIADNKTWRGILLFNIPLSGLAFFLVAAFLQVKQPKAPFAANLRSGSVIVAVASGLTIIGLAWGGIRYPWSSAQVLIPLIIGLFLLLVFTFYEARVPRLPTIPSDILENRTSMSSVNNYLPGTPILFLKSSLVNNVVQVFFQACFGASPLRSAVDTLPLALTSALFAIVAGATITLSQKYRVVNWVGWCFTIAGFGLLSRIKSDSAIGMWVGYQLIVSVGIGMVVISPVFPLLAPLPPNRAAAALLFSRSRDPFSSTVLQNTLQKQLPADFVAQFPPGFEIANVAIPRIHQLPEPLCSEVQDAFADSMGVIWQTMIGFAGLGLLLSFVMREVQMTNAIDENFGLVVEEKVGDDEKL
ncbi:major facilitator superfamily domain-containing protein [Mycena rebaudengoi]|nr:major facilitator superfamily domain-containing protein [Mycena rebaudengoi]